MAMVPEAILEKLEPMSVGATPTLEVMPGRSV